jgi:hypothetical protein
MLQWYIVIYALVDTHIYIYIVLMCFSGTSIRDDNLDRVVL